MRYSASEKLEIIELVEQSTLSVGRTLASISGVLNLESSGVGASDWRPRHEELYQEV